MHSTFSFYLYLEEALIFKKKRMMAFGSVSMAAAKNSEVGISCLPNSQYLTMFFAIILIILCFYIVIMI